MVLFCFLKKDKEDAKGNGLKGVPIVLFAARIQAGLLDGVWSGGSTQSVLSDRQKRSSDFILEIKSGDRGAKEPCLETYFIHSGNVYRVATIYLDVLCREGDRNRVQWDGNGIANETSYCVRR